MSTHRFQPGDKVRVKFADEIPAGLMPGGTYTVAHVDDFGRIQVRGLFPYFSAGVFELVMRKVSVAAASYSLKDGEGDWWFLDMTPHAVPVWRMVDRPDVFHDAEDGVEEIINDYGIDDTPAATPETYCIKDKLDGDWHFSTESAEGPYLLAGGDGSTYRPYEEIADRWGIDAEPLPAVAGAEGYEPGTDERGVAWRRLADHPIFRSCYAEERPLIDAMMAKLDRIHVEGASPARPAEPTTIGTVVHCEEGSVFVRVDAYGRKPWMRSGFDERRSWDEIPAVERIDGAN